MPRPLCARILRHAHGQPPGADPGIAPTGHCNVLRHLLAAIEKRRFTEKTICPITFAQDDRAQVRGGIDLQLRSVLTGDSGQDIPQQCDEIDMVFDVDGYAHKDGTRYGATRTP